MRKTGHTLVLVLLLALSITITASAQIEVPMAVYGYVFIQRASGENVTAPAGLWVYAKYANDMVDNDTTSSLGAYDLTLTGPPNGALLEIWVEETSVSNITLQYMTTLKLNLTIKGTILGDLNGDGTVDIFDVVLIAIAFGSRLGDSNWNALADLNSDGIVDIFDVVILAQNFGKTV